MDVYSASDLAAREIYQGLLDQLSDGLMANDNASMVDGMSFPFRKTTLNEEFIIESAKDWLISVEKFREALHSQGVNHFIRLVTDASFLSENYITGRHMTYIMRNAVSAVEPYENRSTLVRKDGVWRVTEMNSTLNNAHWPISLPQVAQGDLSDWIEDGAEADARRWSTSPKVIYQTFMNGLSRSNLENDFEAWCDHCAFPHSIHMATVDEVAEEPAHIRPFFDMLSTQIAKLEIDEIDRRTDNAEFISATKICGYHITNLRSKGVSKLGPVSSRYILERFGTQWKATSITNSVKNTAFPYSIPELGDALVTLRAIQERTKHK